MNPIVTGVPVAALGVPSTLVAAVEGGLLVLLPLEHAVATRTALTITIANLRRAPRPDFVIPESKSIPRLPDGIFTYRYRIVAEP
jgi:hypothetical protein